VEVVVVADEVVARLWVTTTVSTCPLTVFVCTEVTTDDVIFAAVVVAVRGGAVVADLVVVAVDFVAVVAVGDCFCEDAVVLPAWAAAATVLVRAATGPVVPSLLV
jgi:hypothetical protein